MEDPTSPSRFLNSMTDQGLRSVLGLRGFLSLLMALNCEEFKTGMRGRSKMNDQKSFSIQLEPLQKLGNAV